MTETKTPLRTDVPPDWHPSILAPTHAELLVDGTLGPALLRTAGDAMGALYNTFAKLQDARSASLQAAVLPGKVLGRSEPLPQPVDPARLDAAMMSAFNHVAPKVEGSLATLRTQRDDVAKRLAEKVDYVDGRSPQGIAVATQIRQHVAGLPKTERSVFVQSAIKRGDRATAAAVLSGPGYLSGIDDAALVLLREACGRQFAPIDHAQLASANKLVARVEAARASFVKRFNDLRPKIDPKKTAAADAVDRLLAVG